MINLSNINKTIDAGFPWLIFPKPLETEFQSFIRNRILKRVIPIGISAAGFIILFCAIDWLLLDPALAMHTSVVRLVFVLPVIILVTSWLYLKPPSYYLWIYSATLLFTSLSIIYIIWFTHMKGINLPYEGLMITIMYGFFIMALPFYTALFLNIVMVLVYALTEPLYYFSFADYINHVLFLSIILFSAAIGAYVIEHNQRSNFLRKLSLDILHKNALNSLKQKNKYLAAASHDIRQPLQGIKYIGESIKTDLPNNHKINQLNNGIDTLNSMFNQLLDISKINLNLIKPQFSIFSISDLLFQIESSLSVRVKNKGINITLEIEDTHIRSDYTFLTRVIQNIIENSIKHSQCNEITIKSYFVNNSIKLSIKDNGIGIQKEKQITIFNEFTKGESTTEGLGLGLSIVSQFCDKLGHKLEFSSSPSCTEFSIYLDIPNQSDHDSSLELNTAKKILLIDDDPAVLITLSRKLISWGYDITCANGMHQGMNLLKNEWDGIITDWNLPDGCGNEIIEVCDLKSIPSILISTKEVTNHSTLEKSTFLIKPISYSRLRSALLKIK